MPSHAPITEKTWLAVFDGGRAVVFENEGFDDEPNLKFVFGPKNNNPPTHEQGTDKPGRYGTPAGPRSSVENADFHELGELKFVETLAKELEAAAKAAKFDRLVVVAPAKLLSPFRQHAPHASARVAAERAGDFIHSPKEALERLFKELVTQKG
jgi:protein required for attachment to host cells